MPEPTATKMERHRDWLDAGIAATAWIEERAHRMVARGVPVIDLEIGHLPLSAPGQGRDPGIRAIILWRKGRICACATMARDSANFTQWVGWSDGMGDR